MGQGNRRTGPTVGLPGTGDGIQGNPDSAVPGGVNFDQIARRIKPAHRGIEFFSLYHLHTQGRLGMHVVGGVRGHHQGRPGRCRHAIEEKLDGLGVDVGGSVSGYPGIVGRHGFQGLWLTAMTITLLIQHRMHR